MTQCPDLCTKEKCEELEQRIVKLETIIEELKSINIDGSLSNENLQLTISNNFNTDTTNIDLSDFALDRDLQNHIDTDINSDSPDAHEYTPNVRVDLNLLQFFGKYFLDITVRVDDAEGSDTVNWDKPEINFEQVFVDSRQQDNQIEIFFGVKINGILLSDTAIFEIENDTEINLDGFVENGNLKLFIATQKAQDNVSIALPFDISINGSFEEDILTLTVETQTDRKSTSVNIPTNTNINIAGFVENKKLFLSVATQSDTDTTTIDLPFVFEEDFREHLRNPINRAHIFNPSLFVNFSREAFSNGEYTVAVTWFEDYSQISAFDFDTEIIEMANFEECCNDLSDLIRRENNQNQAFIRGLENLLELRSGQLENLNNQILTELQATVQGQTYEVNCQIKGLGSEETSPFKTNEVEIIESTNSLQGISGIGSQINNLSKVLSQIEAQLCLLSPPQFSFITETPIGCFTQESIEDYLDGSNNLNWFRTFVDNAKNDPTSQIEPTENNLQLNDNFYVYVAYMLDLIHQQQRNFASPICNPEPVVETETVAIVASDRELSRIKGKQLKLHFVTFDNYPKRQRNSSYRPIQIPSPRENLEWLDFESIRWQQGNLYAELELKNSSDVIFKPPISGFFANKEAANAFFNQALSLTTLSESNRKYHEFLSPKKNIPVRETRIYRAFITSVDETGQAICETKFVPPTN